MIDRRQYGPNHQRREDGLFGRTITKNHLPNRGRAWTGIVRCHVSAFRMRNEFNYMQIGLDGGQ